MRSVVDWAESVGRRWAFSLSNAGASYTEFRNRWEQLSEVDWAAVAATDFRDRGVKEGKSALAGAEHRPALEVRRDWHY